MELIEHTLSQQRQRLDLAFDAFAGEVEGHTRLEIRGPEAMPAGERAVLPYADGQFDWVACHDLIETCRSHERQVRLLRELLRIAKRGAFVSTTNRWHPLAHFLRSNHDAKLLDAMTLRTLVDVLPGRPTWKLGHIRLAGIKAHFYLMVWKGEAMASNLPLHTRQSGGMRRDTQARKSSIADHSASRSISMEWHHR